MKLVFIDTSYYVALLSPTDAFRAMAMHLAATLKYRPITTEFVLLEVGNLSSRGKARELFLTLLERIKRNPKAVLIPASPELFARGCELYADRSDKDWSLTDCTSFAVMAEYGVTDALTTDRHLQQAGFNVLLKE